MTNSVCASCSKEWRHCACPSSCTSNPGPNTIAYTQPRITDYGKPCVHWERQGAHGAHCAVHAINGFLQRAATDAGALHRIAATLDMEEAALLQEEATTPPDDNARPNGDFNIQVIQRFLRTEGTGWIVTDTRNPSIRDSVRAAPHQELGFLLNNAGHWITYRRLQESGVEQWYDLDSMHAHGPRRITTAQLWEGIQATPLIGGTVYVIRAAEPGPDSQAPARPNSTDDGENASTTRESRGKLRLGTDFSGMDMAAYALRMTGADFIHAFATENNPKARAHIMRNHQVERIYDDVHARPTTPYSPPTKIVEDKLEKTINIHIRSTARKGKLLNTIFNSKRSSEANDTS